MEQIDDCKPCGTEPRERQERRTGPGGQNPRDEGLWNGAQIEVPQGLTAGEQVVQERALPHVPGAQRDALDSARIGFALELFVAVKSEHM